MLGVLAVAVALTSPVPLPRPAANAADTGQSALSDGARLTLIAPQTQPAWPVDGFGGSAGVPLPASRPIAPAATRSVTLAPTGEALGGSAALRPGSAVAARIGRAVTAELAMAAPRGETAQGQVDGGGVVPLPSERPIPGARAGMESHVRPYDTDAAGLDDAPKPVARPGRSPTDPQASADRKSADAPVVMAMLPPGHALPPGRDRPTLPRNMVCRDPRIVGAPAASFVGNIPGCGIFEPVRVASISGIGMSSPITVDCRTARAFADWLTGVAQPAARATMNTHIESLWIMGSYSCRSRNNQPGKRLSEHSAGRAIDLGGVTMAGGTTVVVRNDWGRGAAGDFLHRIREGACGGFTTVLGPGSDRFHYNHLHLDTAYRGSTYCR